jgi:hypothetical protein
MAEIVSCPACARKLQVPENFLGRTVQCPECKQTFRAEAPSAAPAAAPAFPHTGAPDPAFDLFPDSRSRTGDLDDYDRPLRRPEDYDDDDDDDDRPWRRGRSLPSHRGGMILTFGILALLGFSTIIFGPLAWFMGNSDIAEMRAGRMDPSGEGQTNAGRILGMIATLLMLLSVAAGCLVIAFFVILAITSRR